MVKILMNNKVVLQGTRCPKTNLWQLPLSLPLHQANAVTMPTKIPDMVKFSHASLFSPSISTLQTALDKNYIEGFPGLNSVSLKKCTPHSIAMHKGHMDQTRANAQSTKAPAPSEPMENMFPVSLNGPRTHHCFASVVDFEPTHQVHTDQTGRFPVTSKKGNAYLFVLYDFDSNSIHAEPIKNRSAASILAAYKTIHARLCKAGLKPKLQRLDNECSQILKDFMDEEDIQFQLVPPGIHRRNATKRAIRTWKNHFIAGLCSTDPDFPMNLWDRLVPQANLTINLLRGSRMNPKLSAYAQVQGAFDYNRTPLAPPGTRVLVHEKPNNRESWAPHGVDAWYIGPALESYRCYLTYIWETKAERITDTLEWFPHHVCMPTVSPLDIISAATQDILKALQSPPTNSPLHPLSDSESEALKNLADLLHKKTAPLDTASPPATALRVPTQSPTQPPSHQPPTQPPAALLRVPPTTAIPTPALRVPTPTVPLPPILEEPFDSEEPPAQLLDDENEDTTPPPPPSENPPPLQITQDEVTQTADTSKLPPDTYTFSHITDHQTAPRGSGSKYCVKVHWDHYPPEFVPLNTFTDHYTNEAASTAAAEYAQAHNLLNTKGFGKLRNFLPNNAAHKATHKPKPPRPKLNKAQKHFFHACHLAHQAHKAINPDTGKLAEYPVLLKSTDGYHWEESCCEEIGRLAQGYLPNVPQGTDTIHFIRFDQIPKGRSPTYLRLVVADRPTKSNPRRVRMTVGGDRVNYPGEVRTKTSDLTTAKILINSTISTPGARYMCLDIKDFYLGTEME